MNRRVWIKQIAIVGGAILLIPACQDDRGAISLKLKFIRISDKEESLLSGVVETIIPETGTYGAKKLNLYHFLLKMMDDCYDDKQQEIYVKGLRQLNNYSREQAGNSFNKLTHSDKLTILRSIEKGKSIEDLKYFLAETRKWVIKGYNTSEYFMTKIIPYELVPSRFHVCVKIFSVS
ncbi:hypothetical protein GJU39_12760 [Pedobacter petrophilus]|uniref:Gluconate 2-dehydrogenase subunit 3 family protein n=1 Tax=Pedobacter petrophilus TaxID=1908241 RepID=A0A7K0FZG2_9SPHI|nr:gluconate 2-dehydrogenase subunit 3 family protein [Pedobacter petrophilus]MRX76958.1 hypothetical protein [Pedobacter petrophilus]